MNEAPDGKPLGDPGRRWLLSGVADLVHIFDRGLVDEHFAAATNLDGIPVVPLDATLDVLTVFEDDHHRRLRLDLLLQIKELRVALRCLQIRRLS